MRNFKPRKDKYSVLQKPDSLTDTIMWSHYLVDLFFMETKVSINYFHLQGSYKDSKCSYHSVLTTKTTLSYLENKQFEEVHLIIKLQYALDRAEKGLQEYYKYQYDDLE